MGPHNWTSSICSWLFIMSTVIGYFGVSDADVLLRESYNSNNNNNNVRRKHELDDHPWRHLSKEKLTREDKEQDGEENESSMIDESTWEQLVIRALANPTEWVQLRQALDKVDADLRALTAMENSKQRSNSSSNSKSVPKWRFTYHRVTSPQFQANQSRKSNVPAKAFAAISLANIPFREGNEQQQQQPQQSSIPTPQENEGEEVEEAAKMSGSYGLKGSVINYRKSKNGAMKNTIVDSLGQGKWKSAGEYHYQSEKDGLKESYGSPRVTEKSESQSGSSRSRTQLEEEIAKMSLSHHNNEGSNVAHPSFHWRPWIHTQNSYNDNYHYNRDSNMNPTPSTPTTTTEETTTPKPSTTASVLSSNGNNDDHTETWSQVLQDFHDQLHKTRFSNHHHHHHENEKREHHHRRYHHHPRLELQEDQKQEQQSIQSVITNKADESNELPTDSEELRQRYRHHSRPELHKISDEPSVDPAFTKHPSWTLEYKI